MPARSGISAAAGLVGLAAMSGSADAASYPLAGITPITNESELADKAEEIKAKVDGLIAELAKFGATPADYAKTDACFFGFVKGSPDGTVVTYQLDVDAAETAMQTRSWPVPVVYKEVARTSCIFDAGLNAETCTDPAGFRFALVYFDADHMEFGYLADPKDVRAARANPASLKHSRIVDCAAYASFLESHIALGSTERRSDVRPLVLGYFVSRLVNEPGFATAAEAFFDAKP